MSNTPRITVGMPTYNRLSQLREAVQGVLDQSYTDFEFLIVNDGSSDQTCEFVRTITDPRVTFVDLPRSGPPEPLNEICKRAAGEYILVLHDHDVFSVDLVKRLVDLLDRYPNALFALPGCATVGEDGVSNFRPSDHSFLREVNDGPNYLREYLTQPKSFSSIFHACSLVRRSALEKVGFYYDERFGLYADVDLWLRLLASGSFAYEKSCIIKFREREKGHFLTGREVEIAKWIYSINVINAKRFFAGRELEAALKLARRKHRLSTCNVLLQAFYRRRLGVGLQALSEILRA